MDPLEYSFICLLLSMHPGNTASSVCYCLNTLGIKLHLSVIVHALRGIQLHYRQMKLYSPGCNRIDINRHVKLYSFGCMDNNRQIKLYSPGCIDNNRQMKRYSTMDIDNSKQMKLYSPGCIDNQGNTASFVRYCLYSYTQGNTASFVCYCIYSYTQGNTASFVCYCLHIYI
jgi:hypothetical protein